MIENYTRMDLHIHTPLSHCGRIPPMTAKDIYSLLYDSKDYYSFRDEISIAYISHLLLKAKKLNLSHVGISDHFPEHRETAINSLRLLKEYVLKEKSGINFYIGAECSLKAKGEIDMIKEERAFFDYVLGAPFHWHKDLIIGKFSSDMKSAAAFAKEEIMNALENPMIDGLVHCYPISGSPVFADFDKVFIDRSFAYDIGKKAKKMGKAIEISARFDYSPKSHYRYIVEQWFESGCKLFLGSDAHSIDIVGRKTDEALILLNEYKVPAERLWIPSG